MIKMKLIKYFIMDLINLNKNKIKIYKMICLNKQIKFIYFTCIII